MNVFLNHSHLVEKLNKDIKETEYMVQCSFFIFKKGMHTGYKICKINPQKMKRKK